MDTLRENIKKAMAEQDLNPYTLSEKSGVPQPTIHRFLTGEIGDPRSSTIQKIAQGLNTTEAKLRGFESLNNDQDIKIINSLMRELSKDQIKSLGLFIKSIVNPQKTKEKTSELDKNSIKIKGLDDEGGGVNCLDRRIRSHSNIDYRKLYKKVVKPQSFGKMIVTANQIDSLLQ